MRRRIILHNWFPPIWDAAGFKEGEHPRGQPENAGQFTSGGGGGESGGAAKKPRSVSAITNEIKKVSAESYQLLAKYENTKEVKAKSAAFQEYVVANKRVQALEAERQEAKSSTKRPATPGVPKQEPKASEVQALVEKLKSVGGPGGGSGIIQAKHQAEDDPDLNYIIENGKTWSNFHITPGKEYLGSEGECHWNTAKLFRDGKIDSIVIGYAKNFQGWHQHTWGLKGGKVVETTESNVGNDAWFGAPLSSDNSKKFSEHALKEENSPGRGGVRTKRSGGHKVN